ncbi:MAG: FAD-binding protein [Stappiaceae bacterium]
MTNSFKPRDAIEVEAAVKWAAAEKEPLELAGHNSKKVLGRPVQAGHFLSLDELSGITLYEPEELILSAKAGTPVSEIEKLLSDNGQEFAFEPMDPGPILGNEPGRGTLGGMVATNLSGPRRIKAGAVRDHILGIEAVSGRGEIYKAGGRVVKNVTGYDLARGLAGSWGTLSVLTDITFKVLPKAETEETLALIGFGIRDAVKVMSDALGSSAEVSSAAYVPAESLSGRPLGGFDANGKSLTLLRLEGFGPSVEYRLDKLKDLFRGLGTIERLNEATSRSLWREIRDVEPLAGDELSVLWKVSVAPTDAPRLIELMNGPPEMRYFCDLGGGLVWLRFNDGEPREDLVRDTIAKFGGHAMLMRAEAPLRTALSVFQPQPKALADLTRRLKEQFDPHGILNPGRMYPGV